jgi:hypothetical protein
VTDHPELGEAWKDESGLIWGDEALDAGGPRGNRLFQWEAVSYCASIGARLPTKDEFERLAKFLGKGGPTGYTAEILPHLTNNANTTAAYWTSSFNPECPTTSCPYFFYGDYGVSTIQIFLESYYARCVVQDTP